MRYYKVIKRLIIAIALAAANLAMSGCGGLSSPIDQAYYTHGDIFAAPGGYTRTIFSTSNF